MGNKGNAGKENKMTPEVGDVWTINLNGQMIDAIHLRYDPKFDCVASNFHCHLFLCSTAPWRYTALWFLRSELVSKVK